MAAAGGGEQLRLALLVIVHARGSVVENLRVESEVASARDYAKSEIETTFHKTRGGI
jgi:hypothetical protein